MQLVTACSKQTTVPQRGLFREPAQPIGLLGNASPLAWKMTTALFVANWQAFIPAFFSSTTVSSTPS